MIRDAIDIAWLAGLLEGEGSFILRPGNSPSITVGSTDIDVVQRAHAIMGANGRIHERRLKSGKVFCRIVVNDQAVAIDVMKAVLPLMGLRRSERIRQCIAAFEAKPPQRRDQTHCLHGHPLSGDNLRVAYEGKYPKRRCRICERARSLKYNYKKRAAA